MLQFWEFSYNSSVKYIQGNSSFLQWSSSRRWMCWSRGSRACWSPRQPHLRHRYSQELSLGTGAAPHLETGWICLKSRKPTESFDTVQSLVTRFMALPDRTEHGRVQPCSAVKIDNQKVHLFQLFLYWDTAGWNNPGKISFSEIFSFLMSLCLALFLWDQGSGLPHSPAPCWMSAGFMLILASKVTEQQGKQDRQPGTEWQSKILCYIFTNNFSFRSQSS